MAVKKWYRLDDAATIIPATVHGADTKVFRIVCELKENVDPDCLQKAVDETIKEFPHLNVILRRGFFWYYLDETKLRPLVEEDRSAALSPIYFQGRRNLLYRITYFERRINLEMFHVLADGTGGFTFLKQIVMNYLRRKHNLSSLPGSLDTSSEQEREQDAFSRFYSRGKKRDQLREMISTRAYQIRSRMDEDLTSHLVEGCVSSGPFIELAHSFHTTAGVMITALFIEAVIQTMSDRDKKKPVVVSVPVNLRQYFPSETTRNFFGVINVLYYAKNYDGSLESIIRVVRESYSKQLEKENIKKTMLSYSALSRNIGIKMVPLMIKNPVIAAFAARAKDGTTATLSNLGRIKMPEEYSPYIDHFAPFMSSPNMQICIAAFQDKMVFGAVSSYADHDVLLHFFRGLTRQGLHVELASNDYDLMEED